MKPYKILCTICARGGSKGVKNKNIRTLVGKPMIAHTVLQAKDSGLFEHIVISTDSDAIANTAESYGAEVFFKRDASMASDTAGKLDVIKDAFIRSEAHYNETYDYLIDLDATAPLRDTQDIINAFEQFIKDDNENLITAMPSRRSPYFNMIEKDNDGKIRLSKSLDDSVKRRQDAPECYDMNASIYIWKRTTLLKEDSIFLAKTGLYIMPEERSFDVDCELDFKIVELLMEEKYAQR